MTQSNPRSKQTVVVSEKKRKRQLGTPRVPGTEIAMQFLTLEADKLPEALNLYDETFQAKIIDHYKDDGSVQLKILNSYVIITPCGASSDCFVELPTDLDSIGRIRHDKRFVETELKCPTENQSVMLKDPFGIFFLLIEKKKTTRSSGDDHGLLYWRQPSRITIGFPQDVRPDELCTIKLTALFVIRYGIPFRKALEKKASTEFEFLKLNHIRRSLYVDFLDVYASILKPVDGNSILEPVDGNSILEPVDGSCAFMGKVVELFFLLVHLKKVKMGVSRTVMEVDAFTAAADYFAYMDVVGYSDVMPRPQRRSVMIAELGQSLRRPLSTPCPFCSTISSEVLGIIKLTALFVARYGKRIGWELMEKVGKKNPLFSFLDPSDCGFPCYNMVVKVYSNVLSSFEIVYTTDIVLERYFQCLQWEEEKNELKDLDDLYSFVECVDSFAQIEDQEFCHIMGNREAHVNNPLHDWTSLVHSRAHKKKKMTRSSGDDHRLLFLYGLEPNRIAYSVPQGVTRDELCTIKLTALFVTRYGIPFRKALEKIASTEFGFLKLHHIKRSLFIDFLDVYASILEPSKEVDRSCIFMGKALELFFHLVQLKKLKMVGVSRRTEMEVDAFTAAADYFAYMDVVGYSDVMPRPQRRSVMTAELGQSLRTPLSALFPSWCTVSPEVLGIIKLTALFVARYGKHIGWELMEKVGKKPLFSFLDPSDCGFPCYNMVVKVYSNVLTSFELVYTKDIVLERYFQCLEWDEEKNELKDLDDLYSFVECVDSFAQIEDQEFCHIMGNRQAHVNNPLHYRNSLIHLQAHVYPFHDETPPSNVQEKGCSSIEVCVPTLDGRDVIEITVESFFVEKVASLKEKIVEEIQIPSSKYLKLRGKSVGVLREDKSLADNNVEPGEILTATWRFSRWEE